MVDDLDVGGEGRGKALEVERRHVGGDRARRRRGARACRAVGEQLGVALVQARDGVAQVIVRELLGAPASPVRVDLDQYEVLVRHGPTSKRRARRTRSTTSDRRHSASASPSVASGSCANVGSSP